MGIEEKRKQTQNFESAVADVIDEYLQGGMDHNQIREVLRGHIASDLAGRRVEMLRASNG